MTTYLMLLPLLAISLASLIKPSFATFLSINCGGSNSFVDANSIQWTGDADYVHNGVSQVVDAYYTAGPVMGTLRVFTTLKKNCYTINNLNNGERLLVRASFFYGNYDGKHISPTFDLMLDGNMWGKVNLSIYSEDTILYREYVYDVNGNSTSLCLAQTLPDQFPLISALELRTLDPNMYRHAGSNHVMSLTARFAMGSLVDFRYPVDPYDRLWFSYGGAGAQEVIVNNTANSIDLTTAEDHPPNAAVQTATEATTTGWSPALYTNLRGEYSVYINLYFSEVIPLNTTQKRSIQLYMDNKPLLNPIIPPFGSVLEVYLANITASPNNTFTLGPTSDSTLPTLINAYEVFKVTDYLPFRTNSKDVIGLAALQKAFDVLIKWTGDPCLPSPYWWEWIECTNTSIMPRVTALKLGGFGLSGSLPDFSTMDALQTIELQNNSFDGPIPEFFGSFPNLKLLNLANNRFNGSIPKSISKKKNLKLVVKGNCLDGIVCALAVETPPPMMMTPPPMMMTPPQPNAPSLPPTSGTAPPPDLSNTPPPPNRALTPSPNGSKKIVEELPIILEATIQIFLLSLLFTYF